MNETTRLYKDDVTCVYFSSPRIPILNQYDGMSVAHFTFCSFHQDVFLQTSILDLLKLKALGKNIFP